MVKIDRELKDENENLRQEINSLKFEKKTLIVRTKAAKKSTDRRRQEILDYEVTFIVERNRANDRLLFTQVKLASKADT